MPEAGRFTLLTSTEQIDEIGATLRKPWFVERIKPYRSGRLLNQLKQLAVIITDVPRVVRSSDPTDDFLLALCEGGKADYLVSGDKRGLLVLKRHAGTRILSARDFCLQYVGRIIS